MKTKIVNYLKAGYPALYVVSHEEKRVEAAMREVLEELNKTQGDEPFNLHAWTCTDGLVDMGNPGARGSCSEPMEMLEAFGKAPQKTIYVVNDFHLFVEDKNPLIWRKVKDVLCSAKANNKSLIIIGCRYVLPVELEKEITVIDFTLPTREQLQVVLHSLLSNNGHSVESLNGDEAGVLSAAGGMTTTEAENAFALSVVECGRVSREIVFREKCQVIKRSGLVEVVDDPKSFVTLKDIGGLWALKSWLLKRKNAFSQKARDYGAKTPKGFLAVGNPGTGKSLTAKACRSILDLPLIRLEASKLFGSLVGQTESNWRTAFALVQAMAPCVFWIDEVDGAMSGAASSGQTDGGTTSRTIKAIIQDMDLSEGIFWVLTANDVDNIPTPVLRRMDETWNVELPNADERADVWAIHLTKNRRDPANFDIPALVRATEGFSGYEIEKLLAEAAYVGMDDDFREYTTADVLTVAEAFLPTSKTMAADIERRSKRLAGVAKLASGAAPAKVAPANVAKGTRKISFAKNTNN